jgi:glutamyl endopeptidase
MATTPHRKTIDRNLIKNKKRFHEPISNKLPQNPRSAARGAMRSPSSAGPEGKTVEARGDGALDVDGYEIPKIVTAESAMETAGAEGEASKLRDIGEASFGAPPVDERIARLESVIGPDDRVQVNDTTAFPWRAQCSLLITAADGAMYIGTGWFISDSAVVTAGHCVYIKNSGVPGRDGWVKSIRVMPGRNGAALPFGALTSTTFHAVRPWTDSADEKYDYGAMILPTGELGKKVGHLGFAVVPDEELRATVANISGYPADKASGTQWYHARRIQQVDEHKVYYDIDTFGGQSGSAVYRVIDGKYEALAIHAYGISGTQVVNSGTRITSEVFDNLIKWMK